MMLMNLVLDVCLGLGHSNPDAEAQLTGVYHSSGLAQERPLKGRSTQVPTQVPTQVSSQGRRGIREERWTVDGNRSRRRATCRMVTRLFWMNGPLARPMPPSIKATIFDGFPQFIPISHFPCARSQVGLAGSWESIGWATIPDPGKRDSRRVALTPSHHDEWKPVLLPSPFSVNRPPSTLLPSARRVHSLRGA
ncbi:hypothetical protein EV126DRAFT_20082 [Verticillium dahliae]|nr:hypothetical protein EV126DRAFT_20082 [Verticillium dahliae]